jgi:hypothetical protein
MLREGAAQPLAEYVDDAANVRNTLKAVRNLYCAELDTENALMAALEAEENGEVLHLSVTASVLYSAILLVTDPIYNMTGTCTRLCTVLELPD